MPNYYKKIKGKNFDGTLLKMADSFVKGKGDGRISLTDAKQLLRTVKDSNTYTGIEKNTMKYIRDNYSFTPEADKWFRTEIKKWAATKVPAKKAASKLKPGRAVSKKMEKKKPVKPAPARDLDRFEVPVPLPRTPVADTQESVKKSRWRPIWLALLMIILVVISLSLSPDGRAWIKKNIMPLFSDNGQIKIEEEKTPLLEKAPVEEKAPVKEEAAQPQAAQPKPVVKEAEEGNYYTVQVKDDLVSISEKLLHSYARWKEIYEANRTVITNPNVIYPGQKLKIPETKEIKK